MKSGVSKKRVTKKDVNTVIDLFSTSFTLLLILISIYALVCSYREQCHGKPFFLFGWKPVMVLSDSMEPTYTSGEILLIRETDETPELNDIVMFKQKNFGMNTYVTHRIIGQDANGYITKGDANNSEDPGRIRDDDIVGTVSKVLF